VTCEESVSVRVLSNAYEPRFQDQAIGVLNSSSIVQKMQNQQKITFMKPEF